MPRYAVHAVVLVAALSACTGCDPGDPPDPPGPPDTRLPPLVVAEPEPPRALEPPPGALRATDFGAAPGQDSRAGIQAALQAAGVGGTVVVSAAAAPYLLTSAGANPLNAGSHYALRVPAGVTLHLEAGSILQLADSQQVDQPVDLVIFDGDDVTITGGGSIRGNTAGQPWAGGYQQISAGCLIRSFRPARSAAVSDLHLVDAFSNPVHVESDGPVHLARLRTSATGEGPQVVWARGVVMEDLDHDDELNVAVGDGVEVSVVDGFAISRVRVRAGTAGGGGAALDVFGSSHGRVTDFSSAGWTYGIDAHDYPSPDQLFVTDEVTFRRVRVERSAVTCILSGADQRGHVRYTDLDLVDCGIGLQVLGPAGHPPLTVDSLRVTRAIAGVLLYGSRELSITRGHVSGAHPLDGVLVENRGGSDTPTLTLTDLSAVGSTRHGVHVEAPATILRINGGAYTDNGAGPYFGLPGSAVVVGAFPMP